MSANDIDGSGVDKIFVTFVHMHYWPSFIDVFDPLSDRAAILFTGSGHHRVIGFADVNGDGRKEVIACGPNNRMGWFDGVAAIPVPSMRDQTPTLAFSPDEDRAQGPNPVVWYTLVRRGFTDDLLPMTDDRVHRILTIPLSAGPPVRIGYDGFLVGSGTKSATLRETARQRAYTAIAESQHLYERGLIDDSASSAREATAAATEAQDRYLAQWCQRVLGRDLIDLGRYDEAEGIFNGLMTHAAASDSCFDAAHEFHRRRQLERAIKWYRLGLGRGATASAGRVKYEFLEGEVLALGELGRWREAAREVQLFRDSFPNMIAVEDELAEYVRWRVSGELPARRTVDPRHPDLQRYWTIEMSYAANDDPAALLKTVDFDLQHLSGSDVLLRSVRAGLLDRLGRHEEALRLARATLDEARSMTDDIQVRANIDLVEARYRTIAAHR